MPTGAAPRPPAATAIWLLASHRAGENSQLAALANAVAQATDRPLVTIRPGWSAVANPVALARRPSLAGLSRRSRAKLLATLHHSPPALVVAAGLRSEPVAAWLGQQGARTVLLGRTWMATNTWGLLVTTPQYRQPPADNTLHNPTTLHSLDPAVLAGLRRTTPPPALPRPLTVVLVGGDAGPWALRRHAARALLAQARQLAAGGTVLLTTSARTHASAQAVFSAAADQHTLVHLWRPDQANNPYRQWLAWADLVLVTADSIAMLSEALATGQPVHLFDPHQASARDWSLASAAYRLLLRWGPRTLGRDPQQVVQPLQHTGWLQTATATAAAPPTGPAPLALPATLERTLALLPDPPPVSPGAAARPPGS